jgi:hypothetical protein
LGPSSVLASHASSTPSVTSASALPTTHPSRRVDGESHPHVEGCCMKFSSCANARSVARDTVAVP